MPNLHKIALQNQVYSLDGGLPNKFVVCDFLSRIFLKFKQEKLQPYADLFW